MRKEDTYGLQNRVRLLWDAAAYFERLVARIDSAREVVHFQVYILANDHTGHLVMDALIRAARRGVRVFVLLDAFGSSDLDEGSIEAMRAAGAHVRSFQPIWRSPRFRFGRRLHHKVCVVDDHIAFVTGRNAADRYNDIGGAPAWRDVAVEVEGEAAWRLARVCCGIWNGGPLKIGGNTRCEPPRAGVRRAIITSFGQGRMCPVRVRRNDRLKGRNEITRSYRTLFREAEREVLLMGSYFLPGPGVQGWMRQAVRRGVDVRVVLAGPSDIWLSKYAERHLYARLLEGGVRLYELLPTVLHAKVAVRDAAWCTVGSFNVNRLSDHASIELNLDIADVAFGQSLAQEIHDVIADQCREVTREELARAHWWSRLGCWSAYVIARALLAVFAVRYRRDVA
ncbi:MAG: hypothetical protein H6595_11040 [Flavobacteriales bacterium]|nr:hypothetical protein [Flavobacteriales bacterium]MCB9167997.1 hypothetical protein [Flavobacteriales bacterium]